jgi:hypothetical protein
MQNAKCRVQNEDMYFPAFILHSAFSILHFLHGAIVMETRAIIDSTIRYGL